MDWFQYILSGLVDSFLFYLPAIAFNLATYFLYTTVQQQQLVPLDGGLSIGRNRLIGDGRGIDGIYIAIVCGTVTGLLLGNTQEAIYIAIGANCGCIVSSVLKRAAGIKQGTKAYPLDNVDFILGATAIHATAFPTNFYLLGFGLVGISTLHLLANIYFRPIWETSKEITLR